MNTLIDEKNVHVAFEISLVLKGAFALAEIAAGIFAYVVTRQFLIDLVHAITRTELTEDPRDLVANYLVHAAQDLSVSSQYFTAFYLLSRHQALAHHWSVAEEAGVLSGRHRDFQLVHPLSRVSIQLYAFTAVAAHLCIGCGRHWADVV